jgi:small subunit ribosomal protein S19e
MRGFRHLNRNIRIYCVPGVGTLRRVYGGTHRHGVAPNHFSKASGSVIRKAMQTLEAIKWVEKHPEDGGRILTKQGRKDLDRIASQLRQSTKAADTAAALA